jgi:Tat protein secretion system quality control protein TatD with DNase activity
VVRRGFAVIDTHCHLDKREFDADRAEVLARARAAGVTDLIVPASADQLRAYLGFGLHYAFAGPVTYERARRPLDAARAVPRDSLLLETDAPDQTPRPHRGTRNEPAYLPLVAAGVAAALGVGVDELDALTTANARRLFALG